MAPARINFGMMHAVSRWDIGSSSLGQPNEATDLFETVDR
jgi:hypothetical protein